MSRLENVYDNSPVSVCFDAQTVAVAERLCVAAGEHFNIQDS